MIINIVKGLHSDTVAIHNDHSCINVLDHSCELIRIQDHTVLRLAHELSWVRKEELKDGAMLKVKNQQDQEAVITISAFDPGYTQFQTYHTERNILTAGSAAEDDIQINDPRLLPSQIQINLKDGMITDSINSGIASIDHHPIREDSPVTVGSVLQMLSLQVMFGPDLIRVNSGPSIQVHLSHMDHFEEAPLKQPQVHQIKRSFRTVTLHDSFSCILKEPMHIDTMSQRPLILSMGPALTMSLASAVSGSVAVYNGYLNGRDLLELMPMILLPCVLLISTLFWMPVARLYEKLHLKHQRKKRIREYALYLQEIRNKIESSINQYRSQLADCFQPVSLEDLSNWILKNRNQSDFGMVQIGTADCIYPIQLTFKTELPQEDPLNPMIASLKEQAGLVHDLPLLISLRSYRHIYLVDESADSSYLLQMMEQLLFTHAPDSLRLIILAEEQWLEQHYDVRLIPHLKLTHDLGRMIAVTRHDAAILAAKLQPDPSILYLLFVQNPDIYQSSDWPESIHCILCSAPSALHNDQDCIVTVGPQSTFETAQMIQSFTPLHHPVYPLHSFVQFLNGCRISTVQSKPVNLQPGFLDLYQAEQAADLSIESNWRNHLARNGMIANMGISEEGELITLDFHERGNGPHGIVAGATGQGKSVLLITILLSLAVNYSPREVQFVMIDFKGGGSSHVFANDTYILPHVAGIITNLQQDTMARTLVSFSNECRRREELFRQMNQQSSAQIMSIDDYQNSWKQEYGLDYLSHLLIVVDEFAELKKSYPEFLNDLISLARVGRSLGIHLLLATQKPSGVVNDQIWSNSRFKICLKVQEKQDSMEMLHRMDAALIQQPGKFCFLCDGILQKGKSGYANQTIRQYRSDTGLVNAAGEIAWYHSKDESGPTECSEVIRQIMDLSDCKNLKPELLWLEELQPQNWCAYQSVDGMPLGKLDDYWNHLQTPLMLEPNVNLLVCSMDRQEKICFLNTLLYTLISHTDQNDELYLIDDLHAELSWIAECPQVISVFSASDEERIRNMLNHLSSQNADNAHHCYVIVDDYSALKEQSDLLLDSFSSLIETSLSTSVSIILFTGICSLVPYRMLALFQQRISLRNENLQDLSALFECSVKQTVSKPEMGMILNDHLLQFRMIMTSKQQLQQLVNRTVQRFGRIKVYELPHLPKTICYQQFDGQGIALGINILSYEWIAVPMHQALLVIATYEEELSLLMRRFEDQKLQIQFNPTEEELDQNGSSTDIILVSLQHYEQSLQLKSRKYRDILYLGAGFHDQYRFTIRSKTELKENQAVYYRTGRSQILQLAYQGTGV